VISRRWVNGSIRAAFPLLTPTSSNFTHIFRLNLALILMGVSFNIKEKKGEEFHLPTALFFVA
jgi:hypothetical protein